MMATRRPDAKTVPSEWIDLLVEHDVDLIRVRVLWRRGRARYRPMVSLSVDLEALEGASMNEWERHELEETNLAWTPLRGEGEDDPREHAQKWGESSWRLCERWARSLGCACDFRLRGYGADGQVLFESGRRILVAADEPDETRARDRGLLDEGFDKLDDKKTAMLHWLAERAERSFAMAQDASGAAPQLIGSARVILEQAIDYQNEQVRGLIDLHSGRTETTARAYEARQATQRAAMKYDVMRYGIDVMASTLVPAAKSMFEHWANRSMQVFPEFECAQQAIAYIAGTLTQGQLQTLFDKNRKAADGFMFLLEDAARVEDEREALLCLNGADQLFKSKRFESVADLEQRMAARYILARRAIYRLMDHGEDAPG
ncbi:hypothetical protein G6O69_37235 [Pseudenhygromyxa sp. WMMC2535]|uniref:hypothetical protein n=1 Tax=Pseudenhygromyxa sp. WMMC2535 TaxID=2712867 RepID=UPI0015958C0A|nr:hypothetical protein [Pseudenhygromyxa sp. WMMC2535]NVB40340.1 hypothetical protein [Pseudenhygromyxa sp. WMMC2535]NVB43522.1 hypothetical protein [Pseudenhygromyxa sp. WMMC2535]